IRRGISKIVLARVSPSLQESARAGAHYRGRGSGAGRFPGEMGSHAQADWAAGARVHTRALRPYLRQIERNTFRTIFTVERAGHRAGATRIGGAPPTPSRYRAQGGAGRAVLHQLGARRE